jgi:hypothetical protein
MPTPDRTNKPDTRQSEQGVLNKSQDSKYDVLGVELLAENPAGDALVRLKTDASGNLAISGSITASSSTLADFSVNDIEDAATSYFGNTKPDGTWLIKKLTATSLSYATVTNNGAVTTYSDAWANRVTLTYSRFDEAF